MKTLMKAVFCSAAAISLMCTAISAFPVSAEIQPESPTIVIPNAVNSTTTTTITVAEAEKIDDPEKVRKMITKLISENGLQARVANNEQYPGYMQPIIIEVVIVEGQTSANQVITDFAETYHIDRRTFTIVPFVNGSAVTTVNPVSELMLWGDADCSDQIDISDAVLTAKFVAEDAGASITDQGKLNADTNGDGNITLEDTELILKRIAKKI